MFEPVGIDPSLTSTGYSHGSIQQAIRSKKKGPERLYEISGDLMFLLSDLDAPLVLIEGYAFSARNSQAHALGELGGVIRLSLWMSGIPYVEVPPTVRAKFACGKGNAGKGEVMSAVSARTGIVWSGAGADDLCDAWVLEEIGRCKLGIERFSWPMSHRSALNKIDWGNLPV